TISGKSTPGASVNLLKMSALVVFPAVAVFSDSTYRYELVAVTTADANGNFSFASADYKEYLTPGVNKFVVTANGTRSEILVVNVATPIGIIFDAIKNQPLSNAQVSLYRFDGVLAQPGVDIASTDTNPQTAGSDGSYGFVANSGDYYLAVQLPNYSYPSTRNYFDSSRNIIIGSKMDTFRIGPDILYMDLPLDPTESFSCYPSPFNPYERNITIQYYLDKDTEVGIAVYDLLGNLVKTWEITRGSQYAQKGLNQLPWDGRSGSGHIIANGGYIVLLHADNTVKKFKILVIE
ncbi:MAG: T9SS type A sorting domain-containing protein, partial [bacterium]|nr:T9SS type A sorting domain-containing protein [bacterium]